MNHELSDDLSQWPDEPHAILGVRPGTSPLDLKRAYTRLIRRFKPEQHPEHFRRIREAYDRLVAIAQFYEQYGISVSTDEPETPSASDGDTAEPKQEQSDSEPPTAPPVPIVDRPSPMAATQLDEAWKIAIEGRFTESARRLQELHDTTSTPDAAVRLYWLTTLVPLEATRTPIEWLVAALKRSHLSDVPRDLLRHEWLDDPRSAAHPVVGELWALDVSPERIAEVAEWRWLACALVQSWSTIQNDVSALREKVLPVSESAWLRLLAAAVDCLAWSREPEVRSQWCELMDETPTMEHLARDQGAVFDRLDLLRVVATGWTTWLDMSGVGDTIAALLPLAWTRNYDEVLPLLWDLANRVSARPIACLYEMEPLRKLGAGALAWFAGVFCMLPQRIHVEPREPETVPGLQDFLGAGFWANYDHYRRELLEFCLRNEVSPMYVAHVAAAVGVSDIATTQYVEGDGAIMIAYHAVQCMRW